MTSKSKRTNGAFIIVSDKIEEFLSTKAHTAKEAINRIECRKKSRK